MHRVFLTFLLVSCVREPCQSEVKASAEYPRHQRSTFVSASAAVTAPPINFWQFPPAQDSRSSSGGSSVLMTSVFHHIDMLQVLSSHPINTMAESNDQHNLLQGQREYQQQQQQQHQQQQQLQQQEYLLQLQQQRLLDILFMTNPESFFSSSATSLYSASSTIGKDQNPRHPSIGPHNNKENNGDNDNVDFNDNNNDNSNNNNAHRRRHHKKRANSKLKRKTRHSQQQNEQWTMFSHVIQRRSVTEECGPLEPRCSSIPRGECQRHMCINGRRGRMACRMWVDRRWQCAAVPVGQEHCGPITVSRCEHISQGTCKKNMCVNGQSGQVVCKVLRHGSWQCLKLPQGHRRRRTQS